MRLSSRILWHQLRAPLLRQLLPQPGLLRPERPRRAQLCLRPWLQRPTLPGHRRPLSRRPLRPERPLCRPGLRLLHLHLRHRLHWPILRHRSQSLQSLSLHPRRLLLQHTRRGPVRVPPGLHWSFLRSLPRRLWRLQPVPERRLLQSALPGPLLPAWPHWQELRNYNRHVRLEPVQVSRGHLCSD